MSFQIPIDLNNIPIPVDTDTLVVIIEQFLMLILIIGRWMLPKGDLTRCLAIDSRETLLKGNAQYN
jgi:Transmembrane protein 26